MKLIHLYFNYLYNPLYDLSVAQLSPYHRLMNECLDKLKFVEGDSVLCIGVGTGNEIPAILERCPTVDMTGIDMSPAALRRAQKKAHKIGGTVSLVQMDAHKLDFPDESFDKVACIHVMGFLEDDEVVTREIIRVLKKAGQYVISYPSGAGSSDLGKEVRASIRDSFRTGKIASVLKQCIALVIGGIAYIPGAIWVKPQKGFYSRDRLENLLDDCSFTEYTIREDLPYQDYIVSGIK